MVAFIIIGTAVNFVKSRNKDLKVEVKKNYFTVRPAPALQDSGMHRQAVSRQARVKVNINKADMHEIMRIKGIGRKIAQRIVLYREQKGNFRKPEELMKIKGIGKKKYKKIRTFIEI
jgi:comEA protein